MIVDMTERIEGFIPGTVYNFNPPVLTNCIHVSGKRNWERKIFAQGWCIEFEKGEGVFQGKPVDGKGKDEYYFKVTWGRGSVASEEQVNLTGGGK